MSLWQGEVLVLSGTLNPDGTTKALKVQYEGEEIWLPASWIHANSGVWKKDQVGETGTLVLSEWAAEQKGLLE
jgi:hypothetical protein